MKATLLITLFTLSLASLLVHAGGKAHVHGTATLDIAVEATKITIQLASPLDNLLGYERAPRTDAERQQANTLVTRLKAGEAMFRIDPAAQCTLAKVELGSSALKLGQPDPSEEGHADIDGTFEFICTDAAKARFIDVGLFEFKRLQRLEVQVAASKGQFKRSLKRPSTRIELKP